MYIYIYTVHMSTYIITYIIDIYCSCFFGDLMHFFIKRFNSGVLAPQASNPQPYFVPISIWLSTWSSVLWLTLSCLSIPWLAWNLQVNFEHRRPKSILLGWTKRSPPRLWLAPSASPLVVLQMKHPMQRDERLCMRQHEIVSAACKKYTYITISVVCII